VTWLILLSALGLAMHVRARRRRRLREALHELRRPLTALLLATAGEPRGAALGEQVRAALADFDATLDGRRRARPVRERLALPSLFAEARLRWEGARVRILDAPDMELAADRVQLGMALDNLIANGLEHGSGDVLVTARRVDGSCRVEVSNGPAVRYATGARDPSRGHGLRIAGREMHREGGRLLGPRRAGRGIVTALELPPPPGGYGR
jgi:signal transduction histidine kinase